MEESFSGRQQEIIDGLRGGIDPAIYTQEDVDKADRDLTTYLRRLDEVRDQEPKVREKLIGKAIREVCAQLSEYSRDEYGWEFPQGFLLDGPTQELTSLILDAAFDAGWTWPRPTVRKPTFLLLSYKPTWDWGRLKSRYGEQYMEKTGDKECYTADVGLTIGWGKQYLRLSFDRKSSSFTYDANPFGESTPVPLLDVHADEERLSFGVLSNKYKLFTFLAQTPADQAFFAIFAELQGTGIAPGTARPDDHGFTVEFTDGKLTKFDVTTYDGEHNIVPDYVATTPRMTYLDVDGSSKFVQIYWKGEYDPHEVTGVGYRGGHLHAETAAGPYDFQIRTIPVMNEFLESVLNESLWDLAVRLDGAVPGLEDCDLELPPREMDIREVEL